MGTQKNRLTETFFFEQPKHMFQLMDKKIITIFGWNFLLNWPYEDNKGADQTAFVILIQQSQAFLRRGPCPLYMYDFSAWRDDKLKSLQYSGHYAVLNWNFMYCGVEEVY